MSSLGRPSTRIDLNSGTISAIEEIKKRVDVLDTEVGDEKQYSPSTPATGLFLRIDDIENNLGLPSQPEIEAGGNIIQFQADATGLNLDVETLRTDTDKLQQQVGDDSIDPKTGIFLRLFDIEKADTIIPHYDYEALYYILLQSQYEITDDSFANIKIDNSQNRNLNDILVDILTDVEILKQHKDLTRGMINQSGFGAGTTTIKAPALTNIAFNTRDLTSIGIDSTTIPTFDGSTFSQEFINQKAIEIADFIFDVIPFDIANLVGMDKEAFILEILKAQDPIEFLQGALLSRVLIGVQGDLFVRDGSIAKGPLELTANWLNVNEIAKQAKDLHDKNIQIYNVKLNEPIKKESDGDIYLDYDITHFKKHATTYKLELKYPILAVEDYFLIDGSKSLNLRYWGNHLKIHINSGTHNLALKLKPNAGLTDDNTGIFVNLKSLKGLNVDSNGLFIDYYDEHFRSGAMESGEEVIAEASNKLRLKIDDDGGITTGTNGLKLDIDTDQFLIPTTGNKNGKLQLKLHDGSSIYSAPTGLFIRTDNQTIEKVLTSSGATTKHLAVKLKANGGINKDGSGIFLDKVANHFLIDATGTFQNQLQLKIKTNGGLTDDSGGIFVKLKSGGGLTYDTSATSGLKITNNYFDNEYQPKITSVVNTTSTALVNSTISFNTAKTQLTFTEGSKAKQYRDEAQTFKTQCQTAKTATDANKTSCTASQTSCTTSATTATSQATASGASATASEVSAVASAGSATASEASAVASGASASASAGSATAAGVSAAACVAIQIALALAGDNDTTYSAGTGMSLDGTTFNCDIVNTDTTYTSGTGITISSENVINCDVVNTDTDTTYTSGTGISISSENVINCDVVNTDTTYTGGTGITINGTTINCDIVNTDTDTTYTGGTGITINGTTINCDIVNTDTDTTYTGGTGITINGTTINCDIVNTDTDTTYTGGTGITINGTTINCDINQGIENVNANITIEGDATNGSGSITLNCENNSHGVKIQGPPHSAGATYTLTLPNSDGNANQVLKTDGSGNLSWIDQNSSGTTISSLVDITDVPSYPTADKVLAYDIATTSLQWKDQSSGGSTDLSSITVLQSGILKLDYEKLKSPPLLSSPEVSVNDPIISPTLLNLSYIESLTGMNDWVKIKHSPSTIGKISGNTFSGATIDGTFTIGDATVDTAEWAIDFDATNVKYFCFLSKDSAVNSDFKDRWVVIEKSEIIREGQYNSAGGYGYNSSYPHYYKTTYKPNGFVAKSSTYYTGGRRDQIIYNRSGSSYPDPVIATYYVKNDGTTIDPHTNASDIATDFNSVGQYYLYAENRTTQLSGIEQSVYVKYTSDLPLRISNQPQAIAGTTDYKTLTFTHQLQCYPPSTHLKDCKTDINTLIYTHNVSGADYGNGDYIMQTSSKDPTVSNMVDKLFSDKSDPAHNERPNRVSWQNSNYHNPNDNETDSYSLGGYNGDWVKVQFPQAKILQKMRIYIRTDLYDRAPGVFKIFGSNNGSSWTEVYYQSTQLTQSNYNALAGSGINYPFSSYHEAYISYYEFNITNDTNYLHYAMVVNKIVGNDTRLDIIYLEFLMMVEYELTFDQNVECDILIVGGGGSGGGSLGGGGGGGGVLFATNITLNGTYNIKVGKGGNRVQSDQGTGSRLGLTGINSEFEGTIVYGGGGGGDYQYHNGLSGGSGGGGGLPDANGGTKTLPTYGSIITSSNSTYYGNDGGSISGSNPTSGNGGSANYTSDISGINYTYATGGTGRTNGADNNITNDDGINYGDGGGGGGWFNTTYSGSGGSGIVIIRYRSFTAGSSYQPTGFLKYSGNDGWTIDESNDIISHINYYPRFFNCLTDQSYNNIGEKAIILYEYKISRYTGFGATYIEESIKQLKERQVITVQKNDKISFRISHSSLDESYKCHIPMSGTILNSDDSSTVQYNERGTHQFKYIHNNTTTSVYTYGTNQPYIGGVSAWTESSIILTGAENEEQLRTILHFERQYIDYSGNADSTYNIYDDTYIWLKVLDSAGGGGGGTI